MNIETRITSLENALATMIYKSDETTARLGAIEQRMQLLEDNQRLMLEYMRENFSQIHQSLARLEAK